jgi:hypothetical protein
MGPNASQPWPDAENIRRGEWLRRLRRRRFAVPAAYALGFVLAVAVYAAVSNLWAGRHDNSVISSTSHKASGDLVVSGKGVTITFPAGQGWLNVPVTPNQLARFLSSEEQSMPWLRSAISASQESSIQVTRDSAMLVYRVKAHVLIATCNVSVVAGSAPVSQLVTHIRALLGRIRGAHDRVSPQEFGGHMGVLATLQLVRPGQATIYEAMGYMQGATELAIVTVSTRSAASSLATLRQLAPVVAVS